MPSQYSIIYCNFHSRVTGVSRHVEAMAKAIPQIELLGWGLRAELHCTPLHRLFKLLRRLKRIGLPIVWHAHRNVEALLGLALRGLGFGIKVVVTRHSATPPTALTRWIVGRADHVVAVSQAASKELGALNEKTSIIHHGIDLQRFTPHQADEPPPAPKSAQGIDQGFTARVAVVGRVRPSKGQADFVHAFNQLGPTNQRWAPILLGEVKTQDRALANTLKKQGAISIDVQSDMPNWYRWLDLVVQPSHSEGFGLVVSEAMACGCCVIASSVGAAPHLIEHGVTGFLYPPKDTEALTDILKTVFEDASLRKRVAAQAQRYAQEHFGIDHQAQALAKVYRALTAEGF